MKALKTSERNKFAKEWGKLGDYHDSIPLGEIFEIVSRTTGAVVVDEEGNPWSGMVCGRKGRATFDLVRDGEPLMSMLVVVWEKLDGRRANPTEVICYLS